MGKMRLRLIKSYKHKAKLQPWSIGTVIQVSPQLANDLLADKVAEIYTGEYPPKNKLKTDFFKPK